MAVISPKQILLLRLTEVMVVLGECQPKRRWHLKLMEPRYEYLPGRMESRILALALTWLESGA